MKSYLADIINIVKVCMSGCLLRNHAKYTPVAVTPEEHIDGMDVNTFYRGKFNGSYRW